MELKRYETLDQFIAEYSRKGWQIVSRTDSAVQMRRPKQWNKTGLIIGLIGLPFGGVGLIFFILTLIDYLFQSEQIGYVTLPELRAGRTPAAFSKSDNTAKLAAQAVAIVVFFGVVCYLIFYFAQ